MAPYKLMNVKERIKTARLQGDIAFVAAVCEIADQAKSFLAAGNDKEVIELLQALSSLDIDDKKIGEVVDFARRHLEAKNITCNPSIDLEYRKYLESLTPHNRHIILAREMMRKLARGLESTERRQTATEVVRHFELAAREGPLNKRDLKIVSVLRKEIE